MSRPWLCLLALAVAPALHADVVYLKDGTALHGKAIREMTTDSELGTAIPIGGGFFASTDGVRIVIFSSRQMDTSRPDNPDKLDIRALQKGYFRERPRGFEQPPPGVFTKYGEFDKRGERKVTMRSPNGGSVITQRLTEITPYRVRLDALDYAWSARHLTTELDPTLVRAMLTNHPDLIEKEGQPDADRRLGIYRFWVQMKRYDLAEKELAEIVRLVPVAKSRVEKFQADLLPLQVQLAMDEIELAVSAGRVTYASRGLKSIPTAGIGTDLANRANTLRARFDTQQKEYDTAMRFLRALPETCEGQASEALCEAAAAIREDLDYDGLDRLQPFLLLSEQAERARTQGRPATHKPEELLSMAATGWLLGKESTDRNPASAAKLWAARRFVQEYRRTYDPQTRNRILDRYLKDDPVGLDELIQLVGTLPPPEAEEDLSPSMMSLATKFPGKRTPVDYVLQLPPEYRHGRSYPLLVVLPHDGMSPRDLLELYKPWAMRHGYILAATSWAGAFGGTWEYSDLDHRKILDVVRDSLPQRFNIDTDRVFLSGFGEGANAAWDVGLTYSDLFAGVIPIGSQPKMSAVMPLWQNAIHTPFYVVSGMLAGDTLKKHILPIFKQWMPKGYNSLAVTYIGRGVEWYSGEMPFIFEWMANKRRYAGFPELGRNPGGADNETLRWMRDGGNRFHWLAPEIIKSGCLMENAKANLMANPAQVQGVIRPNNEVSVYTLGVKELTVWFNSRMLDLSKPIKLSLRGDRGTVVWRNGGKPMTPSIEVMLDDLYIRGDRQRPYVVRVTLTP